MDIDRYGTAVTAVVDVFDLLLAGGGPSVAAPTSLILLRPVKHYPIQINMTSVKR